MMGWMGEKIEVNRNRFTHPVSKWIHSTLMTDRFLTLVAGCQIRIARTPPCWMAFGYLKVWSAGGFVVSVSLPRLLETAGYCQGRW